MGGGDKTVGGGYHLACDTQSLQGGDQRQGAVSKQADIGNFQIRKEPFQVPYDNSHC